jgi:hypothetical protein
MTYFRVVRLKSRYIEQYKFEDKISIYNILAKMQLEMTKM